ncbi:MAG: DUF2185 domain-containing protein [Bacteroidota bacterium]
MDIRQLIQFVIGGIRKNIVNSGLNYMFVNSNSVFLNKKDMKDAGRYILQTDKIQELVSPMGYCIASDRITVDGCKVGFMYREQRETPEDSGWRFLAGDETDEYLEKNMNIMMFEVNYIANIDAAIIPYLKHKIGSEYERVEGSDSFIPYR